MIPPRCALLISAALLAAAPPALAQEADWRPVTEEGGVEIWYDADKTLLRDGLTRVIVRSERVEAAPVPAADGTAERPYVTLGEVLMLDCDARTYTSVERIYSDAAGNEVLSTAAPDGPKPFGEGAGVARMSDMVC